LEKSQVFILDASVAVKWYVKEEMRDIALKLREHFVPDLIDPEAPNLILYELGNALRHHPGSRAIDCAEAVEQLRNIGVILHELDGNLIEESANSSYKENITFYGAVYLALAKISGTKLVTADTKPARETQPGKQIQNYASEGIPLELPKCGIEERTASDLEDTGIGTLLKPKSTLHLLETGTHSQKEVFTLLDKIGEQDGH
jgi:predicted nucleic acid-binding protein